MIHGLATVSPARRVTGESERCWLSPFPSFHPSLLSPHCSDGEVRLLNVGLEASGKCVHDPQPSDYVTEGRKINFLHCICHKGPK